MSQLTFNQASKLPGSPSRQYLSKLSKSETVPGFCVLRSGRVFIESEHPEWIELLKNRSVNTPGRKASVKKKPAQRKPKAAGTGSKPTKTQKAAEKAAAAAIARGNKLIEEERELKNQRLRETNELARIKTKKETGELIEFDFAKSVFFSYMERINQDLLHLCDKIEPIIDNLVKDAGTAEVLKRFHSEHIKIIESVKKAQSRELKLQLKELKTGGL